MRALTDRGDAAINGLNAALGTILLISPWLIGFGTAGAATWTAAIGGLVIAVAAFAAFLRRLEWEERVNLVAGLSVIASPWLFGFPGMNSATWTHVIIGLIVAVLAAVELFSFEGAPPARSA